MMFLQRSSFPRSVRTILSIPSRCSRCFYSTSDLPSPTWSVQTLDLQVSHDPPSSDTVQAWADRALLESGDQDTQLQQDLANMMHMLQQVTNHPSLEEASVEALDDVEIYDAVRGVGSARVRAVEEREVSANIMSAATQQVWDSYLEPRTIRQGGAHQYFVINTQEEK
eukprot:Nitzschia sp. Nitz4//scaffold139_size61406//7918//8421//NITZ4_006446-RA/size61406-processed-gene-0.48-mRNA-1//1//CDS//3329535810//849//frame0